MRRSIAWLACLVLALAAIVAAKGAAADTFSVADYMFSPPAGWERMDSPSRMRKAQFIVRGKPGGDDGLAIFFHFGPGQGGSPDANMRRWLSQFAEPSEQLGARINQTRIAGRGLHTFQAAGTLQLRRGGRSVAGYALLAAILESPKGDVFVRFVAPDKLAKRYEADFYRMVEDAMRRRGSR